MTPPPLKQYYPPPPTKIKISDPLPLAKTFLKFLTPPPAPQAGGRGGGVNALKRPTMLYEVVKVICKVKMFYSSLGVSKVFYSSTML